MKKMMLLYRKTLVFTIAFVLSAVNMYAQEYSERKVYKGTYKANKGMVLEVDNKYGDITANAWNKDSVKIITEVVLTTTSYKKLSKLSNSVKIKYTAGEHYILAQSIFGSNTVEFINDLQGVAMDVSAKLIDINYEVYYPEGIELKLTNKYGDIFLGNVTGELNVKLSNGSLKANDITANSSFDLSFVKASVNSLKNAEMKMSYTFLDLDEAESLRLNSKSSELRIYRAGVVNIDSRRDEINIKNIDCLYGNGNYVTLSLGNISREVNCEMQYGRIDLDVESSGSKMIDVTSERTDVNIYIPKKSGFRYDFYYHEDVRLNIPFAIEAKRVLNSPEYMEVKGETQKGAGTSVKLRVLKRSNIKIHYKL